MKISVLLLAAFFSSAAAYPQGVTAYLPAKSAAKAARLLATMDEASAAMDARRRAAREAQLKAEDEALDAFARIASSKASGISWVRADGSGKSADAPAVFAAARTRAAASARLLSAIEEGMASAAESLAETILASGIGEKSSIGLERYFEGKSKDAFAFFPEIAELVTLLRREGAAGAREAAASMARREPERIARSLVAAKARILALSPTAAGPLERLEGAAAAYEAWISASYLASYPGDLAAATAVEISSLGEGIASLDAIGQERMAALLAAMSTRGPRECAAAEAASRLSAAWAGSPAAGRRYLASLCGVSESVLSVFASAAGRAIPLAQAPSAATEPLAAIAALNGLEVAIADEEEPGATRRGPEPALLLLEKRGFAEVARRESRYASLFAEASRRISAIYAQAAEGAQARLEGSPQVAKAAAQALGSAPASLLVRMIDLQPPPEAFGRELAFFATATDAAGQSISFPVRADLAAAEYAGEFARAAGFTQKAELTKVERAQVLAKYDQVVVSAYDPEGSRLAFAIDAFPKEGSPARLLHPLDRADLELALLRGWRP